MKVTVFALLLVAVSAYALPEEYETDLEPLNRRNVPNQVRAAIEQRRVWIRQAGWDPKIVPRLEFEYSSPVLVQIVAFIDSLSFTGASNIAINNLRQSIFFGRIRFDISLPQLTLTIGSSEFSGRVMGDKMTATLRGSLVVRRLGITGEARLRRSLFSGPRIRSLTASLTHPNIQARKIARLNGVDVSSTVNNIFNVQIPNYLRDNRNEIDQQVTDFVRAAADNFLGN